MTTRCCRISVAGQLLFGSDLLGLFYENYEAQLTLVIYFHLNQLLCAPEEALIEGDFTLRRDDPTHEIVQEVALTESLILGHPTPPHSSISELKLLQRECPLPETSKCKERCVDLWMKGAKPRGGT
jgi:hypothetical protein